MHISIIGVGAMGGAMLEGFLRSDSFSASDISISNPHTDRLAPYAEQGVQVYADNRKAAAWGDVVFLVVKPWLVESVMEEISDVLDAERQVLVIVAAGLKAEQVRSWVEYNGKCPATFFALPNTAIAVGASMSFITRVCGTDEAEQLVINVFNAAGETMSVEARQFGAGRALASCGIAYAMRYVRAATEGGVELGFKADAAKDIVLQPIKGAALLLHKSGANPDAEIDMVTPPGGFTIRGLNAMEKEGFTNAVIEGLRNSVKS